MGRLVALVLVMLSLSPAALSAREACEGFQAETFVNKVPALAQRMTHAPVKGEDGVRLVHPDDARISVLFRLQAVAAETPTTRAEFTRDMAQRIAVGLPKRDGTTFQTSVNPYDPVAWTVQSRTVSGEDVDSRGVQTIRIAPTCHLVASWQVYETPLLVSRINEFNASLDAVRALALKEMAPTGFLPDSNVPRGPRAVLLGVGLPILAALALSMCLRSMLFYGRPGPQARAVAAVAAATTALGILMQGPHYADGYPYLRHTDNALLLAVASSLLIGAALTGSRRLMLAGCTMAFSTAICLLIGAWFGWSPDTGVCLFLALALAIAGGSTIWLWQTQAAMARGAARQANHA